MRVLGQGAMVKIAVDWFDRSKHPLFVEWLDAQAGNGLATWRTENGAIEESDVFTVVNPDLRDGADSQSMPEPYWSDVVRAAATATPPAGADGKHHEDIVVWIVPAELYGL